MAKRTKSQKHGAQGHKWLLAHIEEHPHWLSRDLGEDYGIDAEAELTENGLTGEILKLQIKSSRVVRRSRHGIRFSIERKYLEYAKSCRYPVVLVIVSLSDKQAWYIWLQDWMLKQRAQDFDFDFQRKSWMCTVPADRTVRNGLSKELKSIARWRGETQLVLSILDALRSAASTYKESPTVGLVEILHRLAPELSSLSLDPIIEETVRLGERIRTTPEGYATSTQLFQLVRFLGSRISANTVLKVVMRGDSFSRMGVVALGLLYDHHFDHCKSLDLPEKFSRRDKRVAYYCAFREANPEHRSDNVTVDPSAFRFAGLRYEAPDRAADKYANRGPSALLDYLIPDKDRPAL